MQLFSFGHPCEPQLHRTCIGGSNCPLNGYPDMWCCSFIKGKINFKRDRPCEAARCRWNFTHPTSTDFDAVTAVILEGRILANMLDEPGANESNTVYTVENPHVADTVFCALKMLRSPTVNIARKLGQLFAHAALKGKDAKIFTQFLKMMKKPLDPYLIDAYEHLYQVAPATGKKKKDDVADGLRSDIVDVMNSALSSGGHLIDREDQRPLQIIFICSLRTFQKNKKKQEMLETALIKFPSAASSSIVEANLPTLSETKKQELAKAKSIEEAEFTENPRCIGISEIPSAGNLPVFYHGYNPIALDYPDMPILGGLFGLKGEVGYPCGIGLKGISAAALANGGAANLPSCAVMAATTAGTSGSTSVRSLTEGGGPPTPKEAGSASKNTGATFNPFSPMLGEAIARAKEEHRNKGAWGVL